MTGQTIPPDPSDAAAGPDDPLTGGVRKAAARGAFWNSAGNVATQLGTVGVFLVLARFLGPEEFGLVALAAVFLDFVDALIDQGFGHAIVQRRDLEPGHLDSAFAISLGIAIIFMAAMLATAHMIGEFLRAPGLAPVLQVMSVTFLLAALTSVQQAQLRRALDFRSLAVRATVSVVVGGVAGIVAAYAGLGVWSLVIYQLTRELTAVAVLWSASSWRPGMRASRRHAGELWGFSANVIGVKMSFLATRRLGDLIIGRALGTVALGFYSIGQRLVNALNRMLTNSLAIIILPAFSRVDGDIERASRGLYVLARYSSLITFPTFLGAAVLAPDIIPLWFGEQWRPSIPVMQLLSVLGLVQAAGTFNGVILQAIGKPDAFFRLSSLAAVTTIAAIFIGLPYGIVGVAIAILARPLLSAPLVIWELKRHLHWDTRAYVRELVPAAVGSLALIGAVFAFREAVDGRLTPTWQLILSATIAGSAYLLAIRLATPTTFAGAVDLARHAVPRLRRRRSPEARTLIQRQ